MDCPVCPKRDIEDGQLYCPNCKTDLAPLLRTKELPVLVFNQALAHLQLPKANVEQAESQLLLSIQLCPRLVEPHLVLGKLYAQQRHYLAALAQLWMAQKVDPTNKKVQQCITTIVKRLAGRDAQQVCLEADYEGKPVYLWSTLQFLDGNKSFAWRLISNKTEELSHLVLCIGRIFPRLVILPRKQIKEVDRETVLVNLRWRDVKSLPRYHSDATLARTVEEALTSYGPIQAAEHIGIQVEVNDGIAKLSGNVRSEISREIAEEIAGSVPGIVEVNNTIHSDSQLELALAHSLASRIDGSGILVKSLLGQVFLDGEISSASASEVAESVTLATEGVTKVVNRLAVTAPDRGRG